MRSNAFAVPKALTAAIIATRIPATGPSSGAMASAKGAPLLAATRLGRSMRVAQVASK